MADQYSENDANTEASRFLEWPDFLVIGNYFFLFLHSFLNKKKQKLLSSKIVAVVLLQPFTLWVSSPLAFW